MVSGRICILAFAVFVKGQVMPECHYVLFLLRIVDDYKFSTRRDLM